MAVCESRIEGQPPAGDDGLDALGVVIVNDSRMTPTEFVSWCELVALLREQGATIPAIAKLFGLSRSTVGRYLPTILTIAAESPSGPAPPGPVQQRLNFALLSRPMR